MEPSISRNEFFRWKLFTTLFQARHSAACHAHVVSVGQRRKKIVEVVAAGGVGPDGSLLDTVEVIRFSLNHKGKAARKRFCASGMLS